MAKKIQKVKGDKIFRLDKPTRFAHWLYVGCYAVLFLTGLLLFADAFDFLAPLFGGFEMAQLLHRIFAVVFVLPIFILILFTPKTFFGWMKEILHLRKDDLAYFPALGKELLGLHAECPPQGFLNGGEKMNSYGVLSLTLVVILSGFVMWFPDAFSITLVQWAYVAHSGGMALLTAAATIHIYQTAFNPSTKPALEGMLTGYVSADYAKGHHTLWYDKVMAEEKKAKSL